MATRLNQFQRQVLYCAWSIPNQSRLILSSTTDGIHWTHSDAPNAPASVKERLTGFPAGHGMVTSKDVILIPCSLPPAGRKGLWIRNRQQAVLRSQDAGKTWSWSKPILGGKWSEQGIDPAGHHNDDQIYHWELSLFESADGTLGYIARCTSRMSDPKSQDYRTLLAGKSTDGGLTWTQANPIEIDSVSARPFAVKTNPNDGLMLVANDWVRSVPLPSWNTRFGLSLMLGPTDNPDLLLPGPMLQPTHGLACYPNGMINDGKLYVVYTQDRGKYGYANIGTAVVETLPDFSTPFLLPRGARNGLILKDNVAQFTLPESSLSLVLTRALSEQPILNLAFKTRMDQTTNASPILQIGGKTRQGLQIRVYQNPSTNKPSYQAKLAGNHPWQELGPAIPQMWNSFNIQITTSTITITVNNNPAIELPIVVLRKICFGGLSVKPAWPRPAHNIRPSITSLKLDSIVVH